MTAIRLLLAQVDDALLTPEGLLTAPALRAVARLRAGGVELAITSGRSPRAVWRLVEPLGLTTPICAFSGGRLVRPDRSLLEQHALDDGVAAAVIAAMERHGLAVWVYRGDDWLVRRVDAHVAREQAVAGFAPELVGRWEGVVRDVVKIVGVCDDCDAQARCQEDLAALCARASPGRRGPCHLEVVHPRANAGEIVQALSRHLGIPAAAMATIGGAPGDVLMFRESGLGIAMGHACAAVQRCARFTTRSNRDEGFAHAVDAWVLADG